MKIILGISVFVYTSFIFLLISLRYSHGFYVILHGCFEFLYVFSIFRSQCCVEFSPIKDEMLLLIGLILPAFLLKSELVPNGGVLEILIIPTSSNISPIITKIKHTKFLLGREKGERR